MKRQAEKVINPKKSVFLFSKETPQGEMFNFVNGKENDEYKEMLDSGEWFDTPARLNLPKKNELGITVEQAETADPTHLKKMLEAIGFIVMTPEQMSAEANKMASVALDITKFSDEAFIIEAERRGLKEADSFEEVQLDLVDAETRRIFAEDPTSLTKEQLKAFGNEGYGLSLTMNYSEQSMIDKITEAMNAE